MLQILLTVAGIVIVYYTGHWFLKIYENHKKWEAVLERNKVVKFRRKYNNVTDSTTK